MSGYQRLGFQDGKVFTEENGQRKSTDLPERLQAMGVVIPGKVIEQGASTVECSEGPISLSVQIRSEDGNNTHIKYLHYMADDKEYVLRAELAVLNGRQHGLQTEYKQNGALHKIEMYRENKIVRKMSGELKTLQLLDNAKAVLGIRRRDTETLNNDQISVLKKRHTDLNW